MSRRTLILVLVLLVLMTGSAHACPVCFDQNDRNRLAFFTTMIFLTVLPLGIIAGMAWWIRKRMRMQELKGSGSEPLLGEGG